MKVASKYQPHQEKAIEKYPPSPSAYVVAGHEAAEKFDLNKCSDVV